MISYEAALTLAEAVRAIVGGGPPSRQVALAVIESERNREYLRIKDEQIAGLRAKLKGLGRGNASKDEAIGRRNRQNAVMGQEIERLKSIISKRTADRLEYKAWYELANSEIERLKAKIAEA